MFIVCVPLPYPQIGCLVVVMLHFCASTDIIRGSSKSSLYISQSILDGNFMLLFSTVLILRYSNLTMGHQNSIKLDDSPACLVQWYCLWVTTQYHYYIYIYIYIAIDTVAITGGYPIKSHVMESKLKNLIFSKCLVSRPGSSHVVVQQCPMFSFSLLPRNRAAPLATKHVRPRWCTVSWLLSPLTIDIE